MIKNQILIFMILLFLTLQSYAKTALVYKGPESCKGTKETSSCADSAAAVAIKMGYEVRIIGPDGSLDDKVWQKADVWIQPGGLVEKVVLAMKPALLNKIREKVNSGMGYVGFCSGAFLASEKFGWAVGYNGDWYEAKGLGLLPLYGYYYTEFDREISEDFSAKLIEVNWAKQRRVIYWELGPYFDGKEVSGQPQIESIAYYPKRHSNIDSNKVMTLRTTFGAGRVYVTAVHPEAPQDWRIYNKLNDTDGMDTDLAIEMIRWATTKK